jgi:dolichyl-phosphate-mannose-protein mannosyltransferase
MDGIEAGWAIPLLLFGSVAVWQAFLSIAYFNGDLHPDVLETWTLGRSFAWGSAKHPPLMGWIARAWTSIFPLSNWSFQLMALVNSAVGLWIVDLISRRFTKGDKRLVVLMLLMLLPTYQFHAQRFNANSVLLATWPLATYCFLRSSKRAGSDGPLLPAQRPRLQCLANTIRVFDRQFCFRSDLASTTARLFSLFGALGFADYRPCGTRTAFLLAGNDRSETMRLCAHACW